MAGGAERQDRHARANAYVRGQMTADEREAAELLLETDGEFRMAVVDAAERLGLFHRRPREPGEDEWAAVAERIGALPHMGIVAGQLAFRPPSTPREPDRPWWRKWARRLLFRRRNGRA